MTIKWSNGLGGLQGKVGNRVLFSLKRSLAPTDLEFPWRLVSELPGDPRVPSAVADPDQGERLAEERLTKFLSDIGASLDNASTTEVGSVR